MVITGDCRFLHTCEMCEFNNDTDCKADKNEHNRWLVNKRMNDIKHKLIVGSNKGGVGKSTVTTNLAIALVEKGFAVGLADADLHGPNIPKLLQAEDVRLKSTDTGIDPYETKNGLKVASLGFLIEDPNMHIAWRDAVKYDFIIELLGNINWGPLDYLLFDLPPGTGNEQITIIDFIGEVDGAVVVTTPQDLAILDARKMISFARDSNVPIVGIIENMSTMACPHCDEKIDVGNELRKGIQFAQRPVRLPKQLKHVSVRNHPWVMDRFRQKGLVVQPLLKLAGLIIIQIHMSKNIQFL